MMFLMKMNQKKLIQIKLLKKMMMKKIMIVKIKLKIKVILRVKYQLIPILK